MNNAFATNIELLLPCLPIESGLRAHVLRVAALAGRAVQATGGTPQQREATEVAGLLHHYQPDPEISGEAKLLNDLGFTVPARMQPLPVRTQEIVQRLQDAKTSQDSLLELVESANLFDEQFENLPYEELNTEDALRELVRSGMLTADFAHALDEFRVAPVERLLDCVKALPVDLPTKRWFPAKSYEALYAHSMEVAESASRCARESNAVSESNAYLAGVFHDIGRVGFEKPAVKKHLQEWEQAGFPATYAEFLVSGSDHAAIGARVLRSWDFPEAIVEAVRYHHRIEMTSSALAAVLYAAEDEQESLPSCARDHLAAKRLSVVELRCGKAAG